MSDGKYKFGSAAIIGKDFGNIAADVVFGHLVSWLGWL